MRTPPLVTKAKRLAGEKEKPSPSPKRNKVPTSLKGVQTDFATHASTIYCKLQHILYYPLLFQNPLYVFM